jgi:hypothetical protein
MELLVSILSQAQQIRKMKNAGTDYSQLNWQTALYNLTQPDNIRFVSASALSSDDGKLLRHAHALGLPPSCSSKLHLYKSSFLFSRQTIHYQLSVGECSSCSHHVVVVVVARAATPIGKFWPSQRHEITLVEHPGAEDAESSFMSVGVKESVHIHIDRLDESRIFCCKH